MVIGAHPDDPEFGCAGTVMKWAQAGKSITYVLLTSGDKGSKDPGVRPGQLAALREDEQRAAAEELGVERVIFLHYPDGLLENTLDLRRRVCGLLRQHRPHILMAIDPWRRYQLHPDHRAAGQVALDAIYAAREWYIFPEQLIDEAEPWRVKEAYLFWTGDADYWEDITCCVEARIAALMHHTSQVGTNPEKRAERIRERARKAGEQARAYARERENLDMDGYEYAEGFKRFQFR
jgi:LmbE family N-acetylglucosaminyl deacetylase